MATVAFFHAHPDDEAIATGGTMARLASEGHRVICITATRGELGEVEDGFLDEGELLGDRRTQETHEAARLLGVSYGQFLDYRDSDMMGRAGNDDPACFWQADVEEAAQKVAAILREQGVDVLTVYDDHGGYGHPDHIQVHRVGIRAAEIAGVERVYESTIDRDQIAMFIKMARERGDMPDLPDVDGVDDITMGTPGELITTRVDVRAFVPQKRAAMAAHASQIGETSFFLNMSPEVSELVWGTESYIRRGAPASTVEDSLVDGI